MPFAKLERPRTVSHELAALRKLGAKRRKASAQAEAARLHPAREERSATEPSKELLLQKII